MKSSVRFAVGTADGPRSAVWILWKHTSEEKSDIFVAPRGLASVVKVSLHQSGENFDSFTSEFVNRHQRQVGTRMPRARASWKRTSFETSGVARVYQIIFPHSELRDFPLEAGEKAEAIVWIPPLETSEATSVDILLTRPGLESIQFNEFVPSTPRPLAHWFLPNRQNMMATARAMMLAPHVRGAISDGIHKMHTSGSAPPSWSNSTRVFFTGEPTDGVGSSIEVAWPCTVLPPA